jgi:uncharacterized protein YbaP (TraB family)
LTARRAAAALLAWLAALLVLAAPVRAAETPVQWPKAWVVKDGDTEITLFGTVHALPTATQWLSPAVAARLQAADTLVLEALVPEDPAALAGVINKIGLRGDGMPMAKRLTPKQYARLEAAVAASGVPMAGLDRMETWLAALTLSNVSLVRAGIDVASGSERELITRAKAAGTPIVGLETLEQQMGFFAVLPQADQVAMLMATIEEGDSADAMLKEMVALWKAGDVDAIAGAFDKEMKATPLLRQRLLVGRNVRWADWIAGVMRRPGKVFVAVGAGHLGGSDGVLAQLRARGLVPEPVAPEPVTPSAGPGQAVTG